MDERPPRRRRMRSPQKIRLANPHKMHSQLVAAHNAGYEYVPDPAASGARAARKAAITNRLDLRSMYHNPHVRANTAQNKLWCCAY